MTLRGAAGEPRRMRVLLTGSSGWLGRYLASAIIGDRDYVAIQASAIVIAVLFATLNLLLDLIYVWLDPRIRLE